MMRSMFAGIVGLKSQETAMDVIGNNISNVNTVGFKASRVTFQDVFAETLKGASAPSADFGGQNPQQVGLGVGLASIDLLNTPGSLELTGNPTDMAITGNGFFIVRNGGNLSYTRAGNFSQDAQGYIVNPATGARVQGWQADSNGVFSAVDQAGLTDIRIPVGDVLLASPTTTITLGNSLDANAPTGTAYTTSTKAYDTLGREISLTVTFTKLAAANKWQYGVTSTDALLGGTPTTPAVIVAASGATNVDFSATGKLTAVGADATAPIKATFSMTPTGTGAQSVDIDFTTLTQPAIVSNGLGSTVAFVDRNGNAAGSLTTFSVDSSGVIAGVYSNGQKKSIAMVGLATFSNPAGLQKSGSNNYVNSKNSGLPQIGQAGLGGRGSIAPSSLEGSNVDVAAEFTNMIITQRGFQANSRLITTTDEMLQDLVNLKR